MAAPYDMLEKATMYIDLPQTRPSPVQYAAMLTCRILPISSRDGRYHTPRDLWYGDTLSEHERQAILGA